MSILNEDDDWTEDELVPTDEEESEKEAVENGLTEEQRYAAWESLNVLRRIESPIAKARAWADASDEEREVWTELGEKGPLHDAGDDQPHIGEGHPGYDSVMAGAERTNLETLPKIYSGALWVDGETYETVADLADSIRQLAGDERDAEVQRLARILSRVDLATKGAPAFGQVVQRESFVGPDGRHRTILTDNRGRQRVIVTSREETEEGIAELRKAYHEGRDPQAESMSTEFVAARTALDTGEMVKVAALFEKIPTYAERNAFLKSLTVEQARGLDAAFGA